MQVVIDIPEDAYNYIKANGAKISYYELIDAIKNGTPLPKGHGRLIDTNTLKKSLFYDNRQAFTKHQVWLMFSKYNKKVPTVLKAEREE